MTTADIVQKLASLPLPVLGPRFDRLVEPAGGLNDPTFHARRADVEFPGQADHHPLFRPLPSMVVTISTDAELLANATGWILHVFGVN